jgi:hypothetical protein
MSSTWNKKIADRLVQVEAAQPTKRRTNARRHLPYLAARASSIGLLSSTDDHPALPSSRESAMNFIWFHAEINRNHQHIYTHTYIICRLGISSRRTWSIPTSERERGRGAGLLLLLTTPTVLLRIQTPNRGIGSVSRGDAVVPWSVVRARATWR